MNDPVAWLGFFSNLVGLDSTDAADGIRFICRK